MLSSPGVLAEEHGLRAVAATRQERSGHQPPLPRQQHARHLQHQFRSADVSQCFIVHVKRQLQCSDNLILIVTLMGNGKSVTISEL